MPYFLQKIKVKKVSSTAILLDDLRVNFNACDLSRGIQG